MVLIARSVDGAMFGFGVMCYSNGVRRMRVLRLFGFSFIQRLLSPALLPSRPTR